MALTYRGSVVSTVDGTSYSLTSPDLGAGAAGQAIFLFVAASNDSPGGTPAISGITVAGDAASEIVALRKFPSATDMETGLALWGRLDDDGGTPTIVTTWSGPGSDCLGLQVFTATDLTSGLTPYDSGGNTNAAVTGIDTVAGGFLIAGFADWPTDTTSYAWTTATEVGEESIEADIGGFGPYRHGAASIASTSLATGQSVNATSATDFNPQIIVATYSVGAPPPLGNPALEGSATSITATATLAITGIDASVGDMLVVLVAADNAGVNGAASLTTVGDSGGVNVYTSRGIFNYDPSGVDAGATLGMFTCLVTSALVAATITVNFSPNTTQKVATVHRIVPAAGYVPTFRAVGAGSGAFTNVPSITATSVADDDFIFGAYAVETDDALTGDADASNGSWSAGDVVTADAGADAVCMKIGVQWKRTSATGDQTYNPTHSTARDGMINWLTIYGVSSAKTLAADPSSYALSGVAASLERGRKTVAATGSYALTGQAATLRLGKRLIAAASSYVLNGSDAVGERGRKTVAAAGSYALAGQAAFAELGRKTVSAPGSYALTGQTATLRHTKKLVAAPGVYALSGQVAGVLHGWKTVVAAGVYSLVGQDATTEKGQFLAVEAGGYVLTGQDAALEHGWRVVAEPGAYVMSGQVATLFHARSLLAEVGSYELLGQEASLLLTNNFALLADTGSYSLEGQAASVLRTQSLVAEPGSYALNGIAVDLTHDTSGGTAGAEAAWLKRDRKRGRRLEA